MPKAPPKKQMTPEHLAKFKQALAEGYSLGRALGAMGVTYKVATRWRGEHPEFAEAWAKAAIKSEETRFSGGLTFMPRPKPKA